jgi:nucleoside-diphosphate-sugar epimerase
MNVLVTGAAGFLGSRLVSALLDDPALQSSGARIIAADRLPCPIDDSRIEQRIGSIEDTSFADALVDADVGIVYHLAAVLSGEAESDFDLGFRVNVDATRRLLERCRRLASAPRFVFASTIAVFGGPLPDVVPDDMVLRPQSSYGTEKAIAELLVAEYARKGFVDGLACRLATVAVRPGAPNSALSSFVSGIIREPVAAVASVCPVPLDTRLWISAPGTVIGNLLHAARVPTADLGARRAFTLPGLTTTPADMLDSLERHAGSDARARVHCEVDAALSRVVCSWPGGFDTRYALSLGFAGDENVDAIVGEYCRTPHAARRTPQALSVRHQASGIKHQA